MASSDPKWQRSRLGWLTTVLSHLLVAVGLAVVSVGTLSTTSHAAEPSFQKGMSYAAWWSGAYRAPGSELSLQALQSTGANVDRPHRDRPSGQHRVDHD
jgi:hypothetical protein